MEQKWHIRVTDQPRKEVDRALLLQALITLAKQLEAKKRAGTEAEEGAS